MDEILKISNLNKKYANNVVLKNINLSVCKADIYGILGVSGAGKSTLLRCINNLETFDSGTMYFEGKEVTFDKEYKKNIAMIFQSYNLLNQINVLENVMLVGKINKQDNIKKRAINLLTEVGLADKLYEYPKNLSGGQCQRVAIARSLMLNPKILLIDEATSALDATTSKAILNLLKELNVKKNLTIIMISHQMDIIESICNKVAIIDNACIVEDGNIKDIFLTPKAKITKRLIYSKNINVDVNDNKLIKIIFNEEVNTPLLAKIINDLSISLSILYASSKTFNSKTYGQVIFKLQSYKSDIDKLTLYLNKNNISYEEVLANELCWDI